MDKKAQRSDEALDLIMEAINNGQKYSVVCVEFDIPGPSLKNHLIGKAKTKKMAPKGIWHMKSRQLYVST